MVRTIDVHPLTADRFEDVATLFERPGPRGGRQDTANCWCSVWRWTQRGPEANKQALCDLVDAGDEPGLLAYADGQPVGWVSVAPRAQFPLLLRSRDFAPQDEDEGVFVVTCFAVDRSVRGEGVARRLLEAAIAHARARGASAVEAYPGDPGDYKGRLGWFLDAGFTPVRRARTRTVVRLDLAG